MYLSYIPDRRMYWCDAGLNQIESADLDGNNRVLHINTGGTDIHPFDIGIYEDTILWTDWVFPRLVRMNTTVHQRAELVGADVFGRAVGLYIHYGKFTWCGCFGMDSVTQLHSHFIYKTTQLRTELCSKACVVIGNFSNLDNWSQVPLTMHM